jgi:hypothetical protein
MPPSAASVPVRRQIAVVMELSSVVEIGEVTVRYRRLRTDGLHDR